MSAFVSNLRTPCFRASCKGVPFRYSLQRRARFVHPRYRYRRFAHPLFASDQWQGGRDLRPPHYIFNLDISQHPARCHCFGDPLIALYFQVCPFLGVNLLTSCCRPSASGNGSGRAAVTSIRGFGTLRTLVIVSERSHFSTSLRLQQLRFVLISLQKALRKALLLCLFVRVTVFTNCQRLQYFYDIVILPPPLI